MIIGHCEQYLVLTIVTAKDSTGKYRRLYSFEQNLALLLSRVLGLSNQTPNKDRKHRKLFWLKYHLKAKENLWVFCFVLFLFLFSFDQMNNLKRLIISADERKLRFILHKYSIDIKKNKL